MVWIASSSAATNTWAAGGPIARPYGAASGRYLKLLPLAPSASGTSGKLAKFTGGASLGDSIVTESGTTETIAGDLGFSLTTGVGLKLNQLTTTQRDSIGSPAEGSIIHNSTTGRVNHYRSGAWNNGWVRLEGDTMTGGLGFNGTTFAGLTLNSLTTTQRDALSSPSSGSLIWNTTTTRVNNYTGSVWTDGWVRLAGDTMTGSLSLPSGSTLNWNGDVFLNRDAANTLALYNGTAQQLFYTYGTRTDASNYRRAVFTMTTAGDLQLLSEGLGTGATGNSFSLKLNGGNAFTITSGFTTTFTGQVQANNTSKLGWNARTVMSAPADGDVLIQNNAATSFGKMQLGGTTTAFPAIKRNGTGIDVRLADDSAYAPAQSLYDRFGSGTPEANVTAPVGAVYHRTDGGANTSFYVKESGTGNTGWVAK